MKSRIFLLIAWSAVLMMAARVFADSPTCAEELSTITSYGVISRIVDGRMFYLDTRHSGQDVDLLAFTKQIDGYAGENFSELGLSEGASVQVTWDATSRRVLSVDIGRQAYITRIAPNNLIYARVFNGDPVGEAVDLSPRQILNYRGEKLSDFGIRNGAKFRVILDPDTSKVKVAFF